MTAVSLFLWVVGIWIGANALVVLLLWRRKCVLGRQ
jgi:hypothetical protein